MRVLALDSAFGALSAAIADGEAILAACVGAPDAKAAECLPGIVDHVLAGAGTTLSGLDRIAVTLGPGGFTSLRAGLAFAKGLSLGADKPLLGFTTLEALAVSVSPGSTPIASAIDAKRDELFVQLFTADLTAMCPPQVVALDQATSAIAWPEHVRVCGSGADIVARLAGISVEVVGLAVPDAAALARYSQKFSPQERPSEAVYLRPADARPMA